MMNKVSVPRQVLLLSILSMIPFAGLYPFYKIGKVGHILKYYLIALALGIGAVTSPLAIIGFYYNGVSGSDWISFMIMGLYVGIIPMGIISLYYITKWSMEWNDKLHLSDLHDEVNVLPDINEVSHPE